MRRLNGLAKRLAFSTRLNTMTQTNDKRWLKPEAYAVDEPVREKQISKRWRDYGNGWPMAFGIAILIYGLL